MELDIALIQTKEVQDLDKDPAYVALMRRTIKDRRKDEKNNAHERFKALRAPIRSAAQAAREAYIRAREAQPDTPEVAQMLRSKTWESLETLCVDLKAKGWFKPPPRKSMLLREPACAWFHAGLKDNCLHSKFFPSLNKDVVRKAVQN